MQVYCKSLIYSVARNGRILISIAFVTYSIDYQRVIASRKIFWQGLYGHFITGKAEGDATDVAMKMRMKKVMIYLAAVRTQGIFYSPFIIFDGVHQSLFFKGFQCSENGNVVGPGQ